MYRNLIPFLLLLALIWTGCDSAEEPEVLVEEIEVGTGIMAAVGDSLTVHYTGWLEDGSEFDSSVDREPFTFRLGMDRVIDGWHQGLRGMREGGKRRLSIPPELAYGRQEIRDQQGNVVIPSNATLIFEVDLLDVMKPGEWQQ